MADRLPPAPAPSSTRTWRSVVRAVLVRVLAYAILCAVVVVTLVDFGSQPSGVTNDAVQAEDAAASGAGWPHLGGPMYDSRSGETGLADAWPASGPPVLWNREVGAGYSGLIARGGRAYTQTQSLTEQKVLALDADTGRTLWEHKYGWPYQPGGMFPGPRATPTWSDGRLYFAAPDGLVGCLDAADGRAIWSVNVLKTFGGPGVAFGYACSPVVEDGKVILPVGGPSASVVALDAATGATRWASGDWPASYSSPLPIAFRGRRQVAVFLQTALAGFDLQTGQVLWQQAYDRGHEEHSAALIYDEPYLRATQAYRAGSDVYALETGGEKDGVRTTRIKRVRRDAQMSNDVASAVLVDGFLYGFELREMQASPRRPSRGTFRCIDSRTGQVRWSSDRPGQAGIVAADGKLLMLNDSGQALLIRADPSRYEELGRTDVFPGETCWTAPALYGGRLFLRSPTRAACLFVGKPDRMTPRQRSLAAAAPAATAKAKPADLTWLIGGEREFPFEMPDARELARWYGYSMCALAAAAVLAALTNGASRAVRRRWSRIPAALIFWGGLAVFGVLATPLANRHAGGFVFTWPLALIAVHQVALAGVFRSQRPAPRGKLANWAGVGGAALLVLACLLYYKLTRQVSLAPAWYFLVAFPAAWPIAVPAARRLCRPGGLAADVAWMAAVFSAYFWAAGGIMMWRTAAM